MFTCSVRCVFRWPRSADSGNAYLYEERITLWQCPSLDEALELAEAEAMTYAAATEAQFTGLLQGYRMAADLLLPEQGIEVYSLVRESELEPDDYLDIFYDTGAERQRRVPDDPVPS